MAIQLVFVCLCITSAQSDQNQPHEFTYASKTDQGTLTMTGYKDGNPENVNVEFTFKLESDSPFPSGEDAEVRICFEYALNDQFYQKRNRYAFFGKISEGNFSDYVMATYAAQKEYLDDFDWWCSIHKDSFRFHYQWYERDSSIDLLDLNEITSNSAELKFRTKMRDRTPYWAYISWGVFKDEYDNSTSNVQGQLQDDSTKPKHFQILMGDEPAPFADRTFYDTAYWILLIIYSSNFFWIFGLPIMLVLFSFLHVWGLFKVIVDYQTVQNVTEDNPYYDVWTMDNWWLYPFRQLIVNIVLSFFVIITSLIPFFNVFFNLGIIGLIYANMILL